jgi:squalene-hopene/tetraprenyl-beta-curcumene cyclase
VRRYAEQLVAERWEAKGPRWDAEVVATAAALAFNDAATSGTLSPLTRKALDRMWTVQRADGGWNWLKCNWPPMESDDEYGAALAALAAGVAPETYAASEPARAGLAKLRGYWQQHPPPTLHHEAMLVWADTYLPEPLQAVKSQAVVDKLWQLQRPDGGWSLATLGNWRRADGSAQDTEHSDGYGTGFVAYVLRRAGAPADDPRLQRAVAWLKGNQRESGRWFTRSLYKDSQHFITHAGTAFAVMALQTCAPPR